MKPDALRALCRRAEARKRAGTLSREGCAQLRAARQWLLEHDHGEGAVEARRCRESGALRVLYRPGTQMVEEDQWIIVCWDHSTCLSVETRRLGSSHMASADWCSECRAAYEAKR